MTEQLHPMIPPPELIDQWNNLPLSTKEIISIAWQHGADTELEACCEWLKSEGHAHEHEALFAARRPKPPSLKEQALKALSEMEDECLMVTHSATIRRALEQLPND